ncbi:MAG: transposase [Candidatus Limivicinus sp.]|jgi:transposase
MRYSYEFKRKCVEMYRSGQWPETPSGIKQANFRETIRKWARLEDANGPEVLKHKGSNKVWTPEERLELVMQVIAGKSNKSVALENGIDDGMLYRWVRKYKKWGYNGLVVCKKGRPARNPEMKKMNFNNPRKLEETEYEELIRLRAENEYIKAENAVIKKEIALREEKQAAQLKAKKQQSSRRSAKRGIN